MEGGKRPLDALRVQSLVHLQVLKDIVVIVVGKEAVAAHTLEGKNGDHHKDEAEGGNLPGLMGGGSCENGLPGRRIRRALASGFAQARFAGHDCRTPIILNYLSHSEDDDGFVVEAVVVAL